ncbi:hypothetical protein [Geodermatophilus sabuli]|uniref:Uncharacterized protein n=1 Tax=Geodermatophilus sabuli TaxID=1564158 RepID=A0A285EL97_9ACTN|nr:hypothetical protein [Geodermatophilus sabuli]MBB3086875.1 hypothetical protein [Geodermatophilus sabuli]SNX98751.1 hypothetical protein SAMN06893097_11246 [Geodermatophilus sabuli]
MAVEDDVAALAFTAETELGPTAIRAAGRRAAEAARRYLQTTISETRASAAGLRYLAQGPGGFERQMALQVAWEEIGGGRRRVRLTVGDYLVERPRVLGIPVGRGTVPALASARRFAAALRAELTGRVRPAGAREEPAASLPDPGPPARELRSMVLDGPPRHGVPVRQTSTWT